MEKATVIGAAIAGPAAALRLARLGYEVTVYEQRPADSLYSAGILGITKGNWQTLQAFDVPIESHELYNGFTEYDTGVQTRSPFRYITWTGLHIALMQAGNHVGVRYAFDNKVSRPESLKGLVVEATGVAGAARKNLPHTYSGYTIYRGLSRLNTTYAFATYHGDGKTYFTVGHTPDGAFWAFFVPRDEPTDLRTKTVLMPPREHATLPAELRAIVRATDEVFRSPMSDWVVPATMHSEDRSYFTVGDVNGPVRPVTTSGANLAVMEGFAVNQLVCGDERVMWTAERDMLKRRAYDLWLGQNLEGPEIGGVAEDVMYAQHHVELFGTGEFS
jgi:2-polyprenyl-6-methoxyphenol hydroxylase-like FAD-dependent oxidoreductase